MYKKVGLVLLLAGTVALPVYAHLTGAFANFLAIVYDDSTISKLHQEMDQTREEIEKLEQDLGITLPNDYRELLTIHNGMLLYSSYLAEVKYLSIEEIRQKYEEIQEFRFKHLDVEKNKDYPIALLMDVGYVMMKSSRIKNGFSNGAVVVGEIDEEETNMPFYTFLENTINTPFEYFWE